MVELRLGWGFDNNLYTIGCDLIVISLVKVFFYNLVNKVTCAYAAMFIS